MGYNIVTVKLLTRPIRNADGLSLIELMVALAVGVIILIGLISFASTASRDQASAVGTARQLDNANYALQMLKEEIQHAGFYGDFGPDPDSVPLTLEPCETDKSKLRDVLLSPVEGYNASNGDVSCVKDGNYVVGTDILVMRRASSIVTWEFANEASLGAINLGLDENEIYIQGNVLDAKVDQANLSDATNKSTFDLSMLDGTTYGGVPEADQPPAPIRKYIVSIFFVAPCSNLADCTVGSADTVPTLKRLVLRGVCPSTCLDASGAVTGATGPVWEVEPLAEGVENLQFDFGLDLLPNPDRDGVADQWVANPTENQMGEIVSIRAYVTARNIETTLGQADRTGVEVRKTFNNGLSPATGPFADGFKRDLYGTVAQVKNVAMRRGTQ